MKIAEATLLLVTATILLTFAAIASLLAPPFGLDSRDLFVLALGAAGIVLAVLAGRRLVDVQRRLVAR